MGVPGEAQAHLRVALADAEVLPVELATGPEAHERIARGRMDTEDGALRVQFAGQAREVVTVFLRQHRLRPPDGLPGHGPAVVAREAADRHQVVVAVNAPDLAVAEDGERLPRERVVADEIAQANDVLDVAGPDVGEDRLQRVDVRVDV